MFISCSSSVLLHELFTTHRLLDAHTFNVSQRATSFSLARFHRYTCQKPTLIQRVSREGEGSHHMMARALRVCLVIVMNSSWRRTENLTCWKTPSSTLAYTFKRLLLYIMLFFLDDDDDARTTLTRVRTRVSSVSSHHNNCCCTLRWIALARVTSTPHERAHYYCTHTYVKQKHNHKFLCRLVFTV